MAAEDSLLEAFGAGEDMPDDEADVTDMTPEESAVDDMITLHAAGDTKGAAEAFKRAYRLCAASKGKASEPEEPAEEEY